MVETSFPPGSSGQSDSAEWAEPVPLGRQPGPLPVDALGADLAALVSETARGYQVPTDLAVNSVLPLITTAARGGWRVRITPDWFETLALATASVLASGERKSPVQRKLAEPLRDHERDAQRAAKPRVAESQARYKAAEDRAEQLRKQAVKGGTIEEEKYVDACKALADMQVDALPRWLAGDITPETLVSLLAEQRGALGMVSAEPGLFSILAGRYSGGKPNVEAVLMATSGDPIIVDRRGRQEYVPNPCLSIGVCIQPGLLPELDHGTTFRHAGLLGRFLFALPAGAIGTRDVDPEPASERATEAWAAKLTALAQASERRDPHEPAELHLSTEAAEKFTKFRRWLEPRLHPVTGELAAIADWGSKLPGAIARIAGALTLYADPDADKIPADVMAGAISLGCGYVPHALAAFGAIHARSDNLNRARQVLNAAITACRRGEQNEQNLGSEPSYGSSVRSVHLSGGGEFSLRQVHFLIRNRAWVESADDIRDALATLTDYGHVRPLPAESTPKGGRPSQRYQLHPDHCIEETA
jgi:hypothetical protein